MVTLYPKGPISFLLVGSCLQHRLPCLILFPLELLIKPYGKFLLLVRNFCGSQLMGRTENTERSSVCLYPCILFDDLAFQYYLKANF